ncbi:hypothetical protein L218DRAFT_966381 [Marasmius fiardii PR-910]|nr:hypothetical protein L218DRAFT_966381 [Marasmius fiardii PR-910]
MPPRVARATTAVSVQPGLPHWDGDAFVKEVQQLIQECLSTINLLPGTEQSSLLHVLQKLSQPLVTDQVAAHDDALNAFKGAVNWLTLQYQGLQVDAPEGHHKLVIFKDILQKRQNVLKAAAGDNYPNCKRPRACAVIKSKPYIDDADESDVEIITKFSEKALEPEAPESGLKASIHAPNDAADSSAKGKATAKKASGTRANTAASKLPSFKKAHIEVPMSNTAQESPNESVEHLVEAQQVARFTSLVPFLNMDSLEANALLSIANFLKTELATLAHAVQYYSGQYQYVHRQLEEANRHHLAKMKIVDESEAPEGSSMHQDGPSEDAPATSGSNVTPDTATPDA